MDLSTTCLPHTHIKRHAVPMQIANFIAVIKRKIVQVRCASYMTWIYQKINLLKHFYMTALAGLNGHDIIPLNVMHLWMDMRK